MSQPAERATPIVGHTPIWCIQDVFHNERGRAGKDDVALLCRLVNLPLRSAFHLFSPIYFICFPKMKYMADMSRPSNVASTPIQHSAIFPLLPSNQDLWGLTSSDEGIGLLV